MADEESKSLSSVSARVSALSNEVQKLNYDFEELRHATEKSDKELAADMASALMRANEKLDKYVAQEGIYHVEQDRKINELQRSINSLADDLKEPLEVYKTTKYGARAATLIVDLVRWFVPLAAGLLIGYNALQAKMLADLQAGTQRTEQGKSGGEK